MLDQVQHTLRTRIGIGDLKELLFKREKHKSILNTAHNIWLCVEYASATELAHSKGESDIPEDSVQKLANTIFILQAAIVVRLVGGFTNNSNFKNVTTEYYKYKEHISKVKAEREYGTEFITMVEEFKATYETYFKQIKKEEYAKKYAKLAEVLGAEKMSETERTYCEVCQWNLEPSEIDLDLLGEEHCSNCGELLVVQPDPDPYAEELF